MNAGTLGEHRRVLVIDDNTDFAETTVSLLRHYGFDATAAFDGRRGIEAAREFQPDVAILDIRLPDINGYKLARAIREDTTLSGTTLIAVSVYEPDVHPDGSPRADFNYHLIKPVDFNSLVGLIGRTH